MSNRKFTPISFSHLEQLKNQAPILVSKTDKGSPAVTEIGEDRIRVNLHQIGRRYVRKGGIFMDKEAYLHYKNDYLEGKDLSKLGFLRREEKGGDVNFTFVFFDEAELTPEGLICVSLVITEEQAAENLSAWNSRQTELAALLAGKNQPSPPLTDPTKK